MNPPSSCCMYRRFQLLFQHPKILEALKQAVLSSPRTFIFADTQRVYGRASTRTSHFIETCFLEPALHSASLTIIILYIRRGIETHLSGMAVSVPITRIRDDNLTYDRSKLDENPMPDLMDGTSVILLQ